MDFVAAQLQRAVATSLWMLINQGAISFLVISLVAIVFFVFFAPAGPKAKADPQYMRWLERRASLMESCLQDYADNLNDGGQIARELLAALNEKEQS